MGKVYDWLLGLVRVEISGAFPEALLNRCAAAGLRLKKMERPDACTLRASVSETELALLRALAEKSMCDIGILSRSGGSRNLLLLKRRWWLAVLSLLLAGLLCLSSLFLWEIDVCGCEKLSRGQVLRALDECGVTTGAFWPGLSADLVRSHMMTQLPEIGWMTVNVSGSRAVVLIVERKEKPPVYEEEQPADLIAARDGVIVRAEILNGMPLVRPGQAVLAGETLVSGRVESAVNGIRELRSLGKIWADTRRELTAVSPEQMRQKGRALGRISRFALKIGKMRINFYPGSGKLLDGYDKIVHEYNVGVKDLFALPLTVICEKQIRREETENVTVSEEQLQQRLRAYLEDQVRGEIRGESFSRERADGFLYVTIRAQCREDIAETAERDR